MSVGISDNRMRHILGVARQCYNISKDKYGFSEEQAKRMFMLGYTHDVGYEFAENNIQHPFESQYMIEAAFKCKENVIGLHGNPDVEQSIELRILNESDLTVDSYGNTVTVQERLNDIKSRYSGDAEEYLNPLKLAKKLNLI